MPEISFQQAERRSYAVPIVLVAVVIAAAFGLIWRFTPHRVAELAVTRVDVLPIHTVYAGSNSGMKVMTQDQAQEDFYVVAQVRVHDTLKLPIFIKDLTGTVTTADGAQASAGAVQARDIETLYGMFPKLKPMAGKLLPRETEVAPGATAEGAVLLDFPITKAAWDARTSATITVDTYHQGPLTVAIPK